MVKAAVAFLAMATSSAWAWGPVAHAYIAAQAIKDAPPIALFGAMAADMNDFSAWNDALAHRVKHLTHFEADRLPISPFRLGMLTHSSDWGADSYAHAYFHMPTDKLYPMCLYERLSHEVDISMNDAEDVIETLMDYVICRDMGAPFIRRIAEAAEAAGPNEEQALIDGFAEPLLKDMPAFNRDRAEESLRLMFRCDKAMLKGTAELMTMPNDSLLRIAPVLLAAGTGIDSAKAERTVQYGIALCTDWRPQLDQIARAIAAKMAELQLIAAEPHPAP